MRPSPLSLSWRFAPAVLLVLSAQGCTSTSPKLTGATLDAMAVTPAAPSVAIGGTTQLTATGTFSDASTKDLTSQVSWNSSDTTLATVSNKAGARGLAAGLLTGTTTITAAYGSLSSSVPLTVAPLAVTPTAPLLNPSGTKQFTAYINGSSAAAIWTSSDTSVATIDASSGLCTGVAAGTTTIQATVDNTTASVNLSVGANSITNATWSLTSPMAEVPNIPAQGVLTSSFTAYDNWKYNYATFPFKVDTTGNYTALVITSPVINTSWFLTGTFSADTPPATDIHAFFAGIFSGSVLSPFSDSYPSLALTAGTQYSLLVAWNTSVTVANADLVSVTTAGPGVLVFGN